MRCPKCGSSLIETEDVYHKEDAYNKCKECDNIW